MGVLKNDVGRPTNKTIMIRRILKIVGLIIVIGAVVVAGYFANNYFNRNEDDDILIEDDSELLDDEERSELDEWDDVNSDDDAADSKKIAGKIFVYKHTSENNNTSDYYFATSDASGYENKSNYKLINTYLCNNADCSIKSSYKNLYSEINVVVIYDGKYILYDYVNNKSKDVELEGINQEACPGLTLLINDAKLVGYYVLSSDKKIAIYNASANKLVTDYKYSGSDPNYINYKNGYVFTYYEKDEKYYSVIIDISNGKEVITDLDSDSSAYVQLEKVNNKAYFVFSYGPDPGEYKVYNSDFKKIVNSTYDYGLDKSGNIAYSEDSKFYVIDSVGKKLYTSKEYKKYSVKPVNDYVILVDNDEYLKLVDYKGNVVYKFVKLTSDMKVHFMLSGWYTENKKEGIYVVVEDPNVKVSELSEELQKTADGNALGYEYYYIPTTGESGKIPTYIGGYAKPVLYLYPTKDNTKVTVSFEKPELLTTTYPKFRNNWTVTANSNGDLYDKNGKYYYGLYWEEAGSTNVTFDTGFYVTKNNAIEFLEEKLTIIGFNDKERNEFIMYWLPILEKNEKNLVYFELTESRQKYNELKISPKPDSLLRVAIHVKKVDKKTDIKEQKLSGFERKGFTAVEWGGVVH